MKVFIIEPLEGSCELSNCHVVAASDVREALLFLNKTESRVGGYDWLRAKPNVWNLSGAEYDAKEPCIINCHLHIDASEMLKPKLKPNGCVVPPRKRGRKPNGNVNNNKQ